jgi:chemotaxis receptor (MCP) glutamine deamidase CheD
VVMCFLGRGCFGRRPACVCVCVCGCVCSVAGSYPVFLLNEMKRSSPTFSRKKYANLLIHALIINLEIAS